MIIAISTWFTLLHLQYASKHVCNSVDVYDDTPLFLSRDSSGWLPMSAFYYYSTDNVASIPDPAPVFSTKGRSSLFCVKRQSATHSNASRALCNTHNAHSSGILG